MVSYCLLWPWTTHTYHLMIIVTGGLSRNIYLINIIFISNKLFRTILNLFSSNLNTFTKHKEQVCFLFICLFFTCCFIIFCVLTVSTCSYISSGCKHTGRVCSLFLLLLCKHWMCSPPFVLGQVHWHEPLFNVNFLDEAKKF